MKIFFNSSMTLIQSLNGQTHGNFHLVSVNVRICKWVTHCLRITTWWITRMGWKKLSVMWIMSKILEFVVLLTRGLTSSASMLFLRLWKLWGWLKGFTYKFFSTVFFLNYTKLMVTPFGVLCPSVVSILCWWYWCFGEGSTQHYQINTYHC